MQFIFSGLALTGRGYPGQHEVHLEIDTRAQKVTFVKFRNLFKGIYTPSRTEIQSFSDPDAKVTVRENPRDAFTDLPRKWDQHQLMYFVGYTFRYHLTLPFCLHLPGFRSKELEPESQLNGEIWRGLRLEFPEDFPTHTAVQNLWLTRNRDCEEWNIPWTSLGQGLRGTCVLIIEGKIEFWRQRIGSRI